MMTYTDFNIPIISIDDLWIPITEQTNEDKIYNIIKEDIDIFKGLIEREEPYSVWVHTELINGETDKYLFYIHSKDVREIERCLKRELSRVVSQIKYDINELKKYGHYIMYVTRIEVW